MSSKSITVGIDLNNTKTFIDNHNGNTGDLIMQSVYKTSSYSIETLMKDVSLNENEKQAITEFMHLLDKSKQLFNGLRYVF